MLYSLITILPSIRLLEVGGIAAWTGCPLNTGTILILIVFGFVLWKHPLMTGILIILITLIYKHSYRFKWLSILMDESESFLYCSIV